MTGETQFRIITPDPMTILGLRARAGTTPAEIGAALGQAYARINCVMVDKGMRPIGQPLTVYHTFSRDGIDLEAGIPIEPGGAVDVSAEEGMEIRRLEVPRALRAVHCGPYDTLPRTYAKIDAYLKDLGLAPIGPPWEQYISDPGDTPDEDLITEVYFPLPAA